MGAAVHFSSGRSRRRVAAVLFFFGLISLSCAGRLPVSKQKLEKRPSYHPEGLYDENKVFSENKEGTKPITQLWHMNGRCPEDTIPIRRTKKDDVLRASSVKRYGKKKHRSIAKPRSAEPDLINQSGHQHAIAYVEGDKYYGAKATINVWEPKIQQPNEFSLSQLWILGGSFGEDLNSIEAGWQVSPDLYGDNNTRLFTYWTSDAYQATGCYNLLCSGFIQINSEIAMGASISPVSAYRDSQYDISILVWKRAESTPPELSSRCTHNHLIGENLLDKHKSRVKIVVLEVHWAGKVMGSEDADPKEGNWWMQFSNGYVLGYWPSFLFSYLADSASMIEWGGEIVNSEPDGQHTSTQMGSGRFPEEGFGKSSYFRNIQIVDSSNNLKAPKGLGTFTEKSNCYDVQTGSNGDWGHFFYYGGPGRNPNCP
ncbi:carboxyl-terminal peptidase, putative [Actinidia rufa]|uniref:Carboxyl-terminal peptidase, putative n=1 Tax=Actinidia rufa TaxID=165716 RepID=A0A7J0H579_9ERIC|nr:carboxyl-terminal peptidase, putative [Actinidia rufa]